MRKKILLPTDFSKNAWQAMNYAIELYQNDHCDFYVLNVFTATSNILESLLNMEPGSELYETAKSNSEDGLAEVMDKLTFKYDHNPKHHFESISTFNNPIEAIKELVERKDIDMIVMGTKGETGSVHVAYGSTAVYVMEKVRNCPVIVVPEASKVALPKEIVFPTSFKTHYKKRELAYLIELAQNTGATIAILYVSEDDNLDGNQIEQKEMLEEQLEDVPYQHHTLHYQAVEPAVNMFVESRDSDMVAFINKKHSFFGSILSNPMVKNIGFHSRVPILVMHDLRN